MTVGEAIVQERLKLGMDQIELARAAEVDPKTLRALERDERWPREGNRARIERALGWAPGSLEALRDGGEPTPLGIPLGEGTAGAGYRQYLAAHPEEGHRDYLFDKRYPGALDKLRRRDPDEPLDEELYFDLAQMTVREYDELTSADQTLVDKAMPHNSPFPGQDPQRARAVEAVRRGISLGGIVAADPATRALASMVLEDIVASLDVHHREELAVRAVDLLNDQERARSEATQRAEEQPGLTAGEDDQVPGATARRDEDGE